MVTIRTAAVTAAILVAALAAPKADILEQVLVKVNGDIITKTDLEARQIEALRRKMGSQIDPKSLQNDAELRKVLLEITPALLVEAVDELIVTQLGREKGYRLIGIGEGTPRNRSRKRSSSEIVKIVSIIAPS